MYGLDDAVVAEVSPTFGLSFWPPAGYGLEPVDAIVVVAAPHLRRDGVSWNTGDAHRLEVGHALGGRVHDVLAVGLLGQREQPGAIAGRPRVQPAASARRDERHGVLSPDRRSTNSRSAFLDGSPAAASGSRRRRPRRRRGRECGREVHRVGTRRGARAPGARGRVAGAGARQLDRLELRDRLRLAVLEDREVRARQALDRLALLVERRRRRPSRDRRRL